MKSYRDRFPQVRILHVSDLHFGPKHVCWPNHGGASAGIPSLAALIHKDLADEAWNDVNWAKWKSNDFPSPPLIVAVTGDLTEKARPKEFDEAREFLATLANTDLLGSSPGLENIFLVPGNHDVKYDEDQAKVRFAAYCQFYNEFFDSIQPQTRPIAKPEKAAELSQVRAIPNARLVIAEVNSCFYVEKETEDESRGQVDFDTIRRLRAQLEALPPEAKGWIKIGLVHHHPVLLPSFVEPGRGVDAILNGGSLLDLFREHRFQLILHGHKHYPQVFSYDPDSAWAQAEEVVPQLIVAGGSAGSNELPRAGNRSNTYNLITVKWNPDALQARIQIVTRGLVLTSGEKVLDPDQWTWKTWRVFDKVLSPYQGFPEAGSAELLDRPTADDDMDLARDTEYKRLRFNLPIVEVLPSVLPGQGYEARVWLVSHQKSGIPRELPKTVTWSAGRAFKHRKTCARENDDSFFATSFNYWGPTLIQAKLEFDDGQCAYAYVYARLPDSIRRR